MALSKKLVQIVMINALMKSLKYQILDNGNQIQVKIRETYPVHIQNKSFEKIFRKYQILDSGKQNTIKQIRKHV